MLLVLRSVLESIPRTGECRSASPGTSLVEESAKLQWKMMHVNPDLLLYGKKKLKTTTSSSQQKLADIVRPLFGSGESKLSSGT